MSEVVLKSIPEDSTRFEEMLQSLNGTPEGAGAGLIAALTVMTRDRETGRRCVSLADPSLPASRFRFVEERLSGKEYLPASYIAGALPENRYRLPEPPLVIRFSTNPYSGDPGSGRVKLFVQCSGADSPRPLTVVRGADGRWTAVEWSSLLTGIRPPADP